jgi:Lsr2
MKVTVDTRHDSLEEALATVRAAFGSGGTSPNGGGYTAKRRRSVGSAAATPVAKRSPTGRPTTTKKASGRNGRKATAPMNPTSNVAPRGQADAIRTWAMAQGMQVKKAGRLPAAVIQAYRESSHN